MGDQTVRAPTGVEIHPAQEQHLPTLLQLWASAAPVASPTDDLAALTQALHHPEAGLLVAEVDGEIVGSVMACWDGWRGHLYRLVVAPGFRRRGIATALVRRGEALLEELGARRVSVLVLAEGSGAAPFWERCGYVRDPHVERSVKMLRGVGLGL